MSRAISLRPVCSAYLLSFVAPLWAAPAFAHDPALDGPLPTLPEYFPLGIEHVLIGYDHLAFVLGLMLLAHTRGVLLAAVTSFTLAHSLSLSACVLGIVTPVSSWVEAAIAVSIAYVAVAQRASASRVQPVAVSLLFGFVHGFGFAGALEEVGVPLGDTAWALALFNAGVEVGQLLALCCFAPALGFLRSRTRGIFALRVGLLAFGVLLTVSRVSSIAAS
jgi:hypothetical protein